MLPWVACSPWLSGRPIPPASPLPLHFNPGGGEGSRPGRKALPLSALLPPAASGPTSLLPGLPRLSQLLRRELLELVTGRLSP